MATTAKTPVQVAPPAPKVPRIITLLAFGAGIVWANSEFPEAIPAILLLVLLYVALTNIDRVDALLGGFESSVASGFASAKSTAGGAGPKTQ